MKIKLSITLDKDIFDKLKRLKILNNCNMSQIIEKLLRRSKNDCGKFLFDQTNDIKLKE